MYIKTSEQEELVLGIGSYICNWGMHICGLYETEKERDEIIFGFLHRGIIDRDKMLYCPSERTAEDFRTKFTQNFKTNLAELESTNRFSLSSAKALYYPDGYFEPHIMDKNLNAFYTESQKPERCNIRATAEMTWALEAIPGVEKLMIYESRLNYFIPKKPWISICLYNISKFDGTTIMNLLKTHPFTISGGILLQNPFFIPPEQWLSVHAPQYLNP